MTTWTDSLDRARPPAAQPPATVAVRLPPRDCLPWARAAMESEAADVSATPEGARNDRLNAAAYSLGQIVAGGYLSESDVTDALLAAAQRCGLPAREATATIASGLRAGAEHPRHPEERPATASQPRPDTTSEPPADDEWTPTDDDAPDAPPSNHEIGRASCRERVYLCV